MQVAGNEPFIVQENGGNIAIESQVSRTTSGGGIPVVQIITTLEPGNIDDETILFGEGLKYAYAQALSVAHTEQNQDDSVTITVQHLGITGNGGYWGGQNVFVTEALQDTVARWQQAMQSGEEINLAQGGPLTMIFTFTLMGKYEAAFQPPRAQMGARADQRNQRERRDQSKKRMYLRNVYSQMYERGLALRKVPFTEEGLCFPMAFLFCQCRRHVMHPEEDRIIDVLETTSHAESFRIEKIQGKPYHTIPLVNQAHQLYFLRYFKQIVTSNSQHLVLFNPYKTEQPRAEYDWEEGKRYVVDEADTESKLRAWILAARLIHQYVEEQSHQWVDYHDVETCCQAYANVFQVHIHILRVATQMQQTHLFSPQILPEGLMYPTHTDHIYILFGDADGNYEHCHSVTHRRKMVRNPRLIDRDVGGITNYCDYCHHSGDHVRKRDKGLAHLNKCYKKEYRESTFDLETFEKRERKSKWIFFPIRSPRGQRIKMYRCSICLSEQTFYDLKSHKCYIAFPNPTEEEKLTNKIQYLQQTNERPENKLFVYDIETRQVPCEHDPSKLIHTSNCICFRAVDDRIPIRLFFDTIESFCDHLLSHATYLGSTILAHNGGSFDHQFVLQYLERNCIPYEVIPRPGSVHKFLSIEIKRNHQSESIFLKDFMMFFPSSLRSIAESLQLPLQKGDFPHMFNQEQYDDYNGSIPPLESPEDFYCLKSKKDQKEIETLKEWYQEECQRYCTCYETETGRGEKCNTCGKRYWNMKQQLIDYCWLDTDVLAQCVQKFREAHLSFGEEEATEEGAGWIPTAIEPFRYTTLAQVAITLFQRGHRNTQMRPAVSCRRTRSGWSAKSIYWLEKIRASEGIYIQHAGNSNKEYFDALQTFSFVDGYCPSTHTVYEFLGCYWHGCPHCFAHEHENNQKHPRLSLPWKSLYERTQRKIEELQIQYRVISIWECEFDRQYGNTKLSIEDQKQFDIIQDREFFFGGRTEVFSAYARATEQTNIHHLDVTSMYPYICATKMLPFGHPQIIFGVDCQMERLQRNHPDAYFGYVRCEILPNPHCALGLLPQLNEEHKLEFNCFQKTGTWFTEEIYFAMEKGYRILRIFEVFHFTEGNRRDDYMRGYMSFFLRQKQEAEGWKKAGASSDQPSDEEKRCVVQRLFEENGNMGRMRISQVRKDPVKRALAKLYLNCLWGKLAQDTPHTHSTIVYTYEEWMKQIITNPDVDQKSIRYRFMEGDALTCYYESLWNQKNTGKRTNIWLAAAVTAWARVILHTQMFHVGPENVMYCDTDSVVFLQHSNVPIQHFTKRGLGNWANETEEGNEILEFFALAPKCYMKIEKDHLDGIIKCKGVRLTITNKQKLSPAVIKLLMEETVMYQKEDPQPILLDTMILSANSTDSELPYATMLTRIGTKRFRAVLSKRQKVPLPRAGLKLNDITRIYLAPFGPLPIHQNPTYSTVYSHLS